MRDSYRVLVSCPPMLGLLDRFHDQASRLGLELHPAVMTQTLTEAIHHANPTSWPEEGVGKKPDWPLKNLTHSSESGAIAAYNTIDDDDVPLDINNNNSIANLRSLLPRGGGGESNSITKDEED